jgi:hypothetical protein
VVGNMVLLMALAEEVDWMVLKITDRTTMIIE